MKDFTVDGMALAPGVVETIASIAAADIEGVAAVGPDNAPTGFFSLLAQKPAAYGVELSTAESGLLHVDVRIEVEYGYVLPDLADKVRQAIADAITGQTGIGVESVDVYIDGVRVVEPSAEH